MPSKEWIDALQRLDGMLMTMPNNMRADLIRLPGVRAAWARMFAEHFPIFSPAKALQVIEEHLAIKPVDNIPHWRSREVGLRRWADPAVKRAAPVPWDVIACLILALLCFTMFFGFGPTPDNQFVAICGIVCLGCAAICWDGRRR